MTDAPRSPEYLVFVEDLPRLSLIVNAPAIPSGAAVGAPRLTWAAHVDPDEALAIALLLAA